MPGHRDVLCSKCAIPDRLILIDLIDGPSLGSIGHRFQITSQYSERARPHEDPTSASRSLPPRSGFNAGFHPRFSGASPRKHRFPGSLSSSSSRTTFDVSDPNKHGAEPGI
ncbi:unnamed protein product [Pleuronectes platessa]|uniref:Uncharacterized protein n=1 Tax=Pleuronectes platessa TaxID=8262 RepID=A0A9N7URN6_PLEPL|nr:unnamed protein product [Pleuronectes platessa]